MFNFIITNTLRALTTIACPILPWFKFFYDFSVVFIINFYINIIRVTNANISRKYLPHTSWTSSYYNLQTSYIISYELMLCRAFSIFNVFICAPIIGFKKKIPNNFFSFFMGLHSKWLFQIIYLFCFYAIT